MVDLRRWSGRTVELRLSAGLDGDPPRDAGAHVVARAWWGVPLIVAPRHEDPRSHVVLITLDTLRADHLGYGGPDLTPRLDALAEEGLLFEQAWTGCNSTLPSHASILTGLDVPTHGVLSNRSTLATDVRTLAQAFRESGYRTAAAVSVLHLQAGYSGLGRGFDRYLDVQGDASIDGAATLAGIQPWIDDWSSEPDGPIFLWLHLFDPHVPYGPPPEFMARFRAQHGAGPSRERADDPIPEIQWTEPGGFLAGISNPDYASYLYRAGVAYTDELFGRFVDSWTAAGLWESTACIVTADHGESLGEHGFWYGHGSLYQPVMRVPLLARFPNGPVGRIEELVSTVEIARGLQEYVQLEDLQPIGEDPFSRTPGEASQSRRVCFVYPNLARAGMREAGAHVIRDYRDPDKGGDRIVLVYDPRSDPDCARDLSEESPELAERYKQWMDEWMERRATGKRVGAAVSAADEAQLQNLGYGGGEE